MLETIYNHEDENERCGLVLKDGTIVEITNIAEDPSNTYDMSPVEVLPYLMEGKIAGTWHTHPRSDPNLSGEDHTGFLEYPDLVHSIIGWRQGRVVVVDYRIEDGLVVTCD